MMHRCTTSQGNMVGQCSCGLFLPTQTPNSFSMLFSVPNEIDHVFPSTSSSSSSSVDCTLSLGTPSTRFTQDDHNPNPRSPSSCISNFCWDLLHTKNSPSAPAPHKTSRAGGINNNNTTANDPLLARRCANCDTTSTPLWRNGPRGPKSLCNACGIRFKKEERRAAASTTTNGGTAAENMFSHQNNNNPWVHHSQSAQKMACFSPAIGNEFRFINDGDQDSDSGIPFLSWRLNVTDRPSLVHDFTR